MAIQTFTSGQVLTAAQVNALQSNDFNQTVSTKTANYTLVAADKGTRVVMNVSTASTVTVNTSLFSAGDTLVIQNIATNATVVTAGTATVSTAGSLSIPQFGSGTLYFTSASAAIFFPSAGPAASSGLTFINGGSLGTAITFSLPANSFTATYKNYSIFLNNASLNAGTNLMGRLRASGTDTTSADYYFHIGSIDTSGNYAGIGGGSAATSWRIGDSNNTELGSCSGHFHLHNPQTTAFTIYTLQMSTSGLDLVGGGVLATNTQYDSITFFSSNGTAIFNGGTYQLFGYANS